MQFSSTNLKQFIPDWKYKWFNFKKVSFHTIYPATEHQMQRLSFLDGAIKERFKNRLLNKPNVPINAMGYYKVPSGLLMGYGMVADSDKRILYSPELTFDKFIDRRVNAFKTGVRIEEDSIELKEERSIRQINASVINVLMPGMYIYGHWLIDILPKLYMLQQKLDFKKHKIALPNDIPGYWKKFFNLLDIPEDSVLYYDPLKEILACKELILPTKCRVIDGSWLAPYVGTMYDEIVAKYRTNAPAQKGMEKLYLSRRKLKKQFRKCENRAEVSEVILAAGFKEIFPEEYSLEEQIQIFTNAKVLIGEFGSALHNSLFGTKDLKVISLQSNHIPLLVQWGVCNVKQQQCSIIFGEAVATRKSINSDFVIDLDLLGKALEETDS